MKTLSRFSRTAASALAVATVAVGGVVITGAVTTGAEAASCPGSPGWRTGSNTRFNDAFVIDYAPVRTAPAAACTRTSYGHRWHDINSHCFAQNNVGNWWLHLYNRDTLDNGWAFTDNLKGSVSAQYC